MLARMTVDEKIANLDTEAPAIQSLGLNAYNWFDRKTLPSELNTTISDQFTYSLYQGGVKPLMVLAT